MQLITEEVLKILLANGLKSACDPDHDPYPVIKLFTPDANATWLISEAHPGEPDILFGLCDLGLGFPELGSVRLSEIEAIRGAIGLPVERDIHFKAERPISEYARLALVTRSITV
ncbi:Protein of unknown function [Mesorhizobium albiziae]|uniref:DUF2958 domain-containing protein n=1 Tax=Neomesorhizobium albiziae TaxID=335020 RepID=A0A1I4D2F9_9HYPH|nr:single-stranded DNA endonuclease [Mesorhizobium albiziae]SFK86356.1 Protein of unknown function [Mesorhizobium albiziae]